jgi:hypothetical protein
MPHSPRIGEGFADREVIEGLGLPIAWGMEGELGAVMADKDPSPAFGHCHINCRIRSRTLWRHSHLLTVRSDWSIEMDGRNPSQPVNRETFPFSDTRINILIVDTPPPSSVVGSLTQTFVSATQHILSFALSLSCFHAVR